MVASHPRSLVEKPREQLRSATSRRQEEDRLTLQIEFVCEALPCLRAPLRSTQYLTAAYPPLKVRLIKSFQQPHLSVQPLAIRQPFIRRLRTPARQVSTPTCQPVGRRTQVSTLPPSRKVDSAKASKLGAASLPALRISHDLREGRTDVHRLPRKSVGAARCAAPYP